VRKDQQPGDLVYLAAVFVHHQPPPPPWTVQTRHVLQPGQAGVAADSQGNATERGAEPGKIGRSGEVDGVLTRYPLENWKC
jgi:hypothetical protein